VLVGLIADTHGFLGEDACAALAGCELILHAGDIGAWVLPRLQALAPVVAVRGNNDVAGREAELPAHASLRVGPASIAVVHRLADAPAGGWDILVYGHCHRQHADRDGGRLLLNPGAAGRRGFHSERSVALLDLDDRGAPRWEFVPLGPRREAR
jgi:putative phosphoesterase